VSDEKDAGQQTGVHATASRVLESLSLDFKTVRTIILSALVVCTLLSVPLFFILKNFVTFDALDKYLRLTDSVRPKILNAISEELSSGYSRNFIFSAAQSVDNTMLFHASQKRRVTLSISGTPLFGGPQSILLQLNGCVLREWSAPDLPQMYDFDITKKLEDCLPDRRDLHTLRISFRNRLPEGAVYQVKCLVLVYERVYKQIEDK